MTSPFNAKARSKPVSMADIVDKLPTDEPSDNFSKQRLVGMTFNMPEEWHTRFKITAAAQKISMRKLLELSFDAYVRDLSKEGRE